MEKRWVLHEEADESTIAALASALQIDHTLARILVHRGIYTFEAARDFFRPSLDQLHDPFLMKDMDRAIERIERAIQDKEKILIYGDYDVDGTTAVALAYQFFRSFSSSVSFYIPDRHKEGYGISTEGIDYAAAHQFQLIIALDCGIRSVDKVRYARTLGIDFIIGDHHLPGNELPEAAAVLDPKREDCLYPYKELSGCGIAFKIAQAYCLRHHVSPDFLNTYLDLCMISIAADIVPLTGENRILAYHGLKKLNTDASPGLCSLMQFTGKTEAYTLSDVVFLLAPRINAAGRMGDAKNAVKMLISEYQLLANAHSEWINHQNSERKLFDQHITAEALAMIEQSECLIQRKTTVVFQQHWNKGVIGIVASRLTEKYYRPTIVLTESNGKYTGSARSVAGYDLYEALLACADLLEQFGGHKYAAGLTLRPENLQVFSERFEEVVAASISPQLLIPQIDIDSTLSLKEITPKFFRILKQMAPFGPQNSNPVFVSHQVELVSSPQLVGGNHLKLVVKQGESDPFECIGFGLGEDIRFLQKGLFLSICYTIEENNWRDLRRIQLHLKGIKINYSTN